MRRALGSIIIGGSLTLTGCDERDADRGLDEALPATDAGDSGGSDGTSDGGDEDGGGDDDGGDDGGEDDDGSEGDDGSAGGDGTDGGDDGGGEGDAPTCPAGSRDGPSGSSEGHGSPDGIAYSVRTPTSYEPTVGHPLVVVFAGAGGTPSVMEQFTGLTGPTLARGYVIAYADHISPGLGVAESVGLALGIVQDVLERWCIDERGVYLTGHSDGGTLSLGVPREVNAPVTGIGPSALGARSEGHPCPATPAPMPAFIMHGANDTLFPGLGKDAADYFARCNQCDQTPGPALPNGCVPYPSCMEGGDVQYCEHSGSHPQWPGQFNEAMLDFFDTHRRP